MYPFDLRGPEFLFFYLCLSICTILAAWLWRRAVESGDPPRLNLADPYLIAYLRGGANEVVRAAVIALIEQKLLEVNGNKSLQRTGLHAQGTLAPIEEALLRKLQRPIEPAKLFEYHEFKTVCEPYQTTLEQAGLLPDATRQTQRALAFALGTLWLAGIGLYKVQIGLANNRPVLFLVILMVASLICLAFALFPRLTPRGKALLTDTQALYGGLRERGNRKLAPTEACMLAAVFGVGALGTLEYAYAKDVFPRAYQANSSSCGSGCGSSCSSGGDGGGGGCGGGGCGGCGS